MFIEIESYLGDVLLSGKKYTYSEVFRQVREVESRYDRELDNFVPLLCRMFEWTVSSAPELPTYVYDRDTGRLYEPSYQKDAGI